MAFNLFYFIKSWIFMKRTHLIWIFVLIATAIIVLLSCSKQNDPAKIEGTVSLKVNDFIVFGEMHNSFMSNVLEKYQGRGELTSKEEVITISQTSTSSMHSRIMISILPQGWHT